MTHSLPIRQHDGMRTQWWSNFTRTSRVEKYGPGLNFISDEWIDYRDALLLKYNAVYDGKCVNFSTPEDATFFVLRWS